MLKEVVEAIGKVEPAVVDVAIKMDDLIWSSAVKMPPIRADLLLIANAVPGVFVAIPKFPMLLITTNGEVLASSETTKAKSVEVPISMDSVPHGVDEAMPTRRLPRMPPAPSDWE